MNIIDLVNEWAIENDRFPFVECCTQGGRHYCYFGSMNGAQHWPCISFGIAKNRTISAQAFPSWKNVYININWAKRTPRNIITPNMLRFDDPMFFDKLMNYYSEALDE